MLKVAICGLIYFTISWILNQWIEKLDRRKAMTISIISTLIFIFLLLMAQKWGWIEFLK